jgi:hypothetical protein
MKLAFLLLLIAGALEAQVAPASIAGTVVAGAVVTASEDGTGFSRTAVTDARGDYLLEQLAPGTYHMTVEILSTGEPRQMQFALRYQF